jgi:hypothetical protein
LFEFQRPAGCNGFLSCSFSRRLPFQRSLFPSFKVSLTLSLFFFFLAKCERIWKHFGPRAIQISWWIMRIRTIIFFLKL